MIQIFTPCNDIIYQLLSSALRLFHLELYDDIFGTIWDFSYERNYWRGIDITDEGTKFYVRIRGIDHLRDVINRSGFSWNPFCFNDLYDGDCFIYFARDNIVLKNYKVETFLSAIYMIYNNRSGYYKILDSAGKFVTNGFIHKAIFRNLIQGQTQFVYTLSSLSDQTCKKEKSLHEFVYLMNENKVISASDHQIKYTGILGMEYFFEDLIYFSNHGNKEWMQQWNAYINHELMRIARIRIGNFQFLKYCDLKNDLKKSLYHVIQLWFEYFEGNKKYYDFPCLIQIFSKIIIAEKNFQSAINNQL